MSYLSFIRNNKISLFLVLIWSVLIYIGIISYSPPKWLESISSQGRFSEALDLQHEGDRFMKQGEFMKAVNIYDQVLKRWPEMESTLSNLATSYSKLGQYKKATITFEKLIKNNPKRLNVVYFNLAEIYEKTGKTRKAIQYYILSAETAPFPIHSYQKTGELLMNSNKYDKAILAFDEALNHKLTLKNSYIGMLKRDIENYEQGSEDYESIMSQLNNKNLSQTLSSYDNSLYNLALSTERSIAKTYNNLGYCYAMNNNISESVQYFKEALKIWPGFTDARNNLKAIKNQVTQ